VSYLSIHAPQGKITEDSFLRWGKVTIDIAQSPGVDNITIHPNNVKGEKTYHQEKTLRYIKRLRGGRHKAFKPQ